MGPMWTHLFGVNRTHLGPMTLAEDSGLVWGVPAQLITRLAAIVPCGVVTSQPPSLRWVVPVISAFWWIVAPYLRAPMARAWVKEYGSIWPSPGVNRPARTWKSKHYNGTSLKRPPLMVLNKRWSLTRSKINMI